MDFYELLAGHGIQLSPEDQVWSAHHQRELDLILLQAITNRLNTNGTEGIFEANETFFGPEHPGVLIVCDQNFKDWFSGKIEKQSIPIQEPCVYNSKNDFCNKAVIPMLGGEDCAETTLGLIWWLICVRQNQNNQDDVLLQSIREGGLFYIRDRKGILRVVVVSMDDGHWNIYACPLNSGRWDKKINIFTNGSIQT
ncbi:MAG: hypothetical protein RIQ54_467 [Candidatus Parcubacteria bacterium]